MDIAEVANDFHDWELLQSSSDTDSPPVDCPDSGEFFNETDSGGLIQVNYFSVDSQYRHLNDLNGNKSAHSDNPSWIDPRPVENPTLYPNKEYGEFWSDSGSEHSDDHISRESDGKSKEMFSCQNQEMEVRDKGIREISGGKAEDLRKFCLESSEVVVSLPKHSDCPEKLNSKVELEVLGEESDEIKKIDASGGHVMNETGNKDNDEVKKGSAVWWKIPVEFVKYCVFRMSPVWVVSVATAAAAMMGFVILGRRLHKMKKKIRGLEINVAVDNKKVSEVMSRAARLNEAFLIVKRVPVIRPSMPAVSSANTWPVMSLR